MIKGLYTSASGMLPAVKRQEMIANNLANVKTAGFKKDAQFTRELSRAQEKARPKEGDWQQALEAHTFVDYQPGVFDKTGNPLNLAIDGDGFFVLQGEDGSTALTRSGAFVVDADGYLAQPGGFRLLTGGGTVQVGNGQLSVSATGQIEVDGLAAGTLTPQSVEDITKLERIGNAMFAVPQGEELIPSINATVRQGFLESSNVDVVHQMVDMIVSYRNYEANAQSLSTQDKSLEHLFSKVGSRG